MHPRDDGVESGAVGGHDEHRGAGGHLDGGQEQVHAASQHIGQKEVEEAVTGDGLRERDTFCLSLD